MALDNLDREVTGSINPADLIVPTKVVVTSAPQTEERLDNLYKAVNDVATHIDLTAAQQLQVDREFVTSVTDLKESLTRSPGATGGQTKIDSGEAIAYLSSISEATQGFWKAGRSRSTIWVGLSKIDGNALKSIKQILIDCGLCGVGNVIKTGIESISTPSGAANEAALRQTTDRRVPPGLPPGGRRGGPPGGRPGGPGGPVVDAETVANAQAVSNSMRRWVLDLALLIPFLNKWMLEVTNIHPINILPSMKDLNTAREQVRHIVYLTRGFGDTNRDMEKTYRNVHKDAMVAGVTTEHYQKQWLKNLERGVSLISEQDQIATRRAIEDDASLSAAQKAQKLAKMSGKIEDTRIKRAKSLTTSAIHTAQQLGMEAGSLNETFMDWNIQLGMSAGSVGRVGDHMMNISRSTGVFGSKLQEAIKSSEQIMKHLQRTGSLTESAAKNVTEMSTAAGKYGVGDLYQKMIMGTSSIEDFQKMDRKMQAMMVRAMNSAQNRGMNIDMRDLWSGRLATDPKAFKEFFEKGMAQNAKDIIGRITGANVDNLDMTKLNEFMNSLPKEQKFVLENLLKQQGLVVGELEAMAKTVEETGTTLDQRKEKFAAKRKALETAFGVDVAKKMPEYLESTRQEMELVNKAQMDAMGQYMEAVKKGPDAVARLGEELKSRYGDDTIDAAGMRKEGSGVTLMKQLQGGTAADDMMSKLQARAKAANVDFDKKVKEVTGMASGDLKRALRQAVTTGKGAEEVMEQVRKVGMEVEKKERVGQDPTTRARDEILEWHQAFIPAADKLTEQIARFVGAFWPAMGALELFAAALFAIAGGRLFRNIIGGMGGFGGRGGPGPGPVIPRGAPPGPGPRVPPGGPGPGPGPRVPPGGPGPGPGPRVPPGGPGPGPRVPTPPGPVMPTTPGAPPVVGRPPMPPGPAMPTTPGPPPVAARTPPGPAMPTTPGPPPVAARTPPGPAMPTTPGAPPVATPSPVASVASTLGPSAYERVAGKIGGSRVGRGFTDFGNRLSGSRNKWVRGAGWAMKGLGWGAKTGLKYAPELAGTAVGAYKGYKAGEKEIEVENEEGITTTQKVHDWRYTLGGAAAGGAVGHLGGRAWRKGRGVAATAAESIAGQVPGMTGQVPGATGQVPGVAGMVPGMAAAIPGMPGSDMSQFPGWGENCVPVCIVGGMDQLAGGLIPGMAARAMPGGMAGAMIPGAGAMMPGTPDVGADVLSTAGTILESAEGTLAKAATNLANKSPIMAKSATMLSKAAGPLAMVAAGVMGGTEAEKEGKTFSHGAGYGALTGGGTTGSMIGGMVGVEKGGTTDTLMALGESAGYGALAGAAIGSAFFGAGAGPGAAIGAIVGPIIKGVQMLGEKFQWVADIAGTIINPIGDIIEGLWTAVKGIWDIIAGIFTLDFSRVWEGIKGIFAGILGGIGKALWSLGAGLMKTLAWALQGLIGLIGYLPQLLIGLIKSVFLDFPKWIYDSIASGLKSLASNEWIGPIIEPFVALWDAIGESAGVLFNPIMEAFNWLYDSVKGWGSGLWGIISPIFDSIREFFGLEKAAEGASMLGDALKAVGSAIGWVASALGSVLKFVIKVVGWILKLIVSVIIGLLDFGKGIFKTLQNAVSLIIQVFMGVKGPFEAIGEFVMGMVNGVVGWFKWLWDFLVGHSLIPDLINGIIDWFMKLPGMVLGFVGSVIKFFALLPFRIIKGLFKLGMYIVKAIPGMFMKGVAAVGSVVNTVWSGFTWLKDKALEMIYKIPILLWEGFKSFIGLVWKGIKSLGSWLWEGIKKLPGIMWEGLKTLTAAIWDGLKAAFVDFPEWILNLLKEGWNEFRDWMSKSEAERAIEKSTKGALAGGATASQAVDKRIEEAKKSGDMTKTKEELEWALKTQQERLKGIQTNLEKSKKARANEGIFDKLFGAGDAPIKKDEALMKQSQARIAELQAQLKALQAGAAGATGTGTAEAGAEAGKAAEKAAESTTKFQEQAMKPGSIYVHDIHTEVLFKELLKYLITGKTSLVKNETGIISQTLSTLNKLNPFSSITNVESHKAVMPAADVKKLPLEKRFIEGMKQNAQANQMLSPTSVRYNELSLKYMNELLQEATDIRRVLEMQGPEKIVAADSINGVSQVGGIKPSRNIISGLNNAGKETAERQLKRQNSVRYLETGAFNRIDTIDQAYDKHNESVQRSEAPSGIIAEVLKDFVKLKKDEKKTKSGILIGLSRSLDYQRSASEAAEKSFGVVSTGSMDYGEETKGVVNPSLMDYGDETKGIVNPAIATHASIEESLERRRYTDRPGAAMAMPSMDEVSDYLTQTQASKLDTMISYLRSIDDKLTVKSGSSVIRSRKNSSLAAIRPGVKNIAMDMLTGALDFTSPAWSPASITTDGRGGTG